MKSFLIAALLGVVGYVVGAVACYFLVEVLSSNQHDRSLEAAMTGAFLGGPLAALLTFVIGLVCLSRKRPGSHEQDRPSDS